MLYKEMRDDFGKNGQEKVKAKFSIENYNSKISSLYATFGIEKILLPH
jgi:hypothetical protein